MKRHKWRLILEGHDGYMRCCHCGMDRVLVSSNNAWGKAKHWEHWRVVGDSKRLYKEQFRSPGDCRGSDCYKEWNEQEAARRARFGFYSYGLGGHGAQVKLLK